MRLRFKLRTSRDVPWLNYSVFDALWGLIAPLLAFLLRDSSSFDPATLQDTLLYAAVAGVFTALAFGWFRLSHSVAQFFSAFDALSITKASFAAVLLTMLICFGINRLDTIPRSVPLLHFFLLAAGNVAGRTFRRVRVRRRNRIRLQRGATENIVIVGVSELSLIFIQIVEEFSSGTRQIVALLDNRTSMQGRFVHGYPVAGRIHEIEQVVEEYNLHGVRVDKFIVALESSALSSHDADTISRVAALKKVSVDLLPRILGLDRLSESRDDVIEIDESATRQLQNRKYWASKRAFDCLMALVTLIVSTPVIVAATPLVILDCGMPFLFWQVRIGRYGHRITVLKFRTLKAPYDSAGEQIPEMERTSTIGHILRKTRIDELPQLFSVIIGEMSLIGPRPLLPVDLPERIGLRLAVRPGLTGWAQVNGATLLTIEEKDAMDDWYVRHASWATDFTIMVLSARMFLTGVRRNEAAIREALAEKQSTSVGAGTAVARDATV